MPENIKSESELKIEQEKKEADMASKLSSLEKKVEGTEVVAKLLADPDVRELLEAKQRGEKVRLVMGEEPAKIENSIDEADLEAMSNRELAGHILKSLSKNLDGVLVSKLEPLTKTLKNLESYIGNNEAKTVVQQIEEGRKKYSDFNDYVPAMQELNKVNPGLSIEELYLISRKRKVGPEVAGLATERPTSSSTKVVEKKRDVPLPRGKAGFDILIGEALDKLDLSEIG